jgi:hypothetical protein
MAFWDEPYVVENLKVLSSISTAGSGLKMEIAPRGLQATLGGNRLEVCAAPPESRSRPAPEPTRSWSPLSKPRSSCTTRQPTARYARSCPGCVGSPSRNEGSDAGRSPPAAGREQQQHRHAPRKERVQPDDHGVPPDGSPEGEIGQSTRSTLERGGSEEQTVRKIGQDGPSHQRPYPWSAPKGIPGPERVGVERHRTGSPSPRRRSMARAKRTMFNVASPVVGPSMDVRADALTT